MNLMSYNCRGLGKTRAVDRLAELVRRESPHILFLMETKCDCKKMDCIKRKLGFLSYFSMDCVGRSGGLCLLWEEGGDLSVVSFTSHHIDANVCMGSGLTSRRFIGFYGWPRHEDKLHSFKLLKRLSCDVSQGWMCVGDFNQILNIEDKNGGNDPDFNLIIVFREALDVCGLKRDWLSWESVYMGQWA